MDKSISFFDGGAEGFYHGLMLGLIALMDNQYKIKSNRESGDGRFDVSLIPREKRYPGIILELKWKEKLSDVELEKWSNEALKQIGELRYDSEMKEDGITEILKFGIAFSALLFWFFQSTNLFVAYYSDKFNSTEKGPAQLILSHPHKSFIFVLFFNLVYPQALGNIVDYRPWIIYFFATKQISIVPVFKFLLFI